jgi:hypothetical protein
MTVFSGQQDNGVCAFTKGITCIQIFSQFKLINILTLQIKWKLLALLSLNLTIPFFHESFLVDVWLRIEGNY